MNLARNFFIMSSGHSGSTLLNMILGSHSQAVAVGELTHLPKNLALNTQCSCGQNMNACTFWQAVVDDFSLTYNTDLRISPYSLQLGYIGATKVKDKKSQTTLYRAAWRVRLATTYFRMRTGAASIPILERKFEEGNVQTLKLYDSIRRVSGKRFVVDSSKAYLKGIGLHQLAPERTKLILLCRDGRASFYSRRKAGASRRESLQSWKRYYDNALPVIDRCVSNANLIRVRYEELASSPEAEVQRICLELGIPFEQAMLDFRSVSHHLTNGNRMRSAGRSEIRLDEAWRRELADHDRAYFDSRATAINQLLGYR